MKITKNIIDDAPQEIIEYSSLNEFYEYICKTPFNETFRWADHSSVSGSEYFTKTKDFNEAVELFKSGWSDMATKLVQRLKVKESKMEPIMKSKTTIGVAGYQPIVPLFLSGVPTNMVSKKMVPVKQKVITINKSIDYSGGVSADTIIEESIKAFQIIKKLEAQNYRCNLNIILGSKEYDLNVFIKVRIKNANEKLNISKLAFPLVHPSMLRRLFFRWIEVYPSITKSFVSGYGRPSTATDLKEIIKDNKGEYLLPAIIRKNVNDIRTIDDLENA